MSLTAFQQPVSEVQADTQLLPTAGAANTDHTGYSVWLGWLQKLLGANALALYLVNDHPSDDCVRLAARWPANTTMHASAMQLAMRAAGECKPVQATTHDTTQATTQGRPAATIVCVPRVTGIEKKRASHVLVFERDNTAKTPLQTQLMLVTWSFDTLSRYADEASPLSRYDDDTQASLLNTHELWPVSTASFAQCAEQLARLSHSQRCVIARLPVRGESSCTGGACLLAVSGQPRVDNRLSVSRQLVKAIDVAFVGKELTSKPVVEMDVVLSSTAATSTDNDERRGLRWMLPMKIADQWLVVSLEQQDKSAGCVAEQPEFESISRALIGMVLLADRQTLGIGAAIQRGARRLRSKATQRLSGFAVASTIGIGLMVVLLYPVAHRVSAPLGIEAAEQHVLIAPVDGFVKSVAVSAGDRVTQGQVLARLDDQELDLALQKLQSEALQNQQAYSRSLAVHDRVEMTRLKEEGVLINTETARLDLQREKMVLRAPVDAIVLSGSWEDFLGAAVSAGDTLFALGSDNSHRLVLDVSENDVRHVKPDQPVAIRLAAEPSRVHLGRVTAIMPLAVAEAGASSVQVHASLDQDVLLRPGMQGIGKVLIGEKSRLMQWCERAYARLIWLGWKLGIVR